MADRRSAVIGELGEKHAARYLEQCGYHIIDTNVHLGHLEIDIIAQNQDTLVFVEVKTRRQIPRSKTPYKTPAEAVDEKKQEKLIRAAEAYLTLHPCEKYVRIDVSEIYSDPRSDVFAPISLTHLPNAVKKQSKFK